MSGMPSGNMSHKEIRTGQVLNGVAMVGGANAMRMAVKEFKHTRHTPVANLAQRAGVKRLAKVPGLKRIARNPRAAALGLGGGALLLHSGELVGDAISARSLHNQAKSSVSSSVVKMSDAAKQNANIAGGLAELGAGTYATLAGGNVIQRAGIKQPLRELRRPIREYRDTNTILMREAKSPKIKNIKPKSLASTRSTFVPAGRTYRAMHAIRGNKYPHTAAALIGSAAVIGGVTATADGTRRYVKGALGALIDRNKKMAAANSNVKKDGGAVRINSNENGITKSYVSPVLRSTGYGVNIAKADNSWKNISHYQDRRSQGSRTARNGKIIAGVGATSFGASLAQKEGLKDAIDAYSHMKRVFPGAKRSTLVRASFNGRPLASIGVAGAGLAGVGAGMYAHGAIKRRNAEQKIAELRRKRGSVAKAYRRFDPEADRQRRLGTYAGVGLGAGIGLGAASHQSFSRHYPNAGAKIAQAVKAKKFRKPAALGTAALVSTALGTAAYRRGVSERNNPWN